MATRLTFLCAAATAASRSGGFPDPDATLDQGGARKAAALRLGAGRWDRIVSSPSRAARDTAAALGLAAEIEPALADMAFGAWSGRSFDVIAAESAEPLMDWFADPTSAAPGGETLGDVAARVGAWLDGSIDGPPAILAISHASVLRAALAHALALPLAATLQIDVAPLATLVLSHNGRWRLQALGEALPALD